ncbi:MAG TPA: FixH family protein [Gemmatimonadales bacterium]
MFELLLKYRPVVFETGRFVWAAQGWQVAVAGALAVAAAAALVVALRRHRLTTRQRIALGLLRATALALVAAALLRPALLVSTAIAQRNVLGILLDDSQSMRIADAGPMTRGATLEELFGPEAPVVRELAERFQLRFFRFGGTASRRGAADSLRFDGERTDLAAVLDHARRDLAALPLAGLVLVSDGADNADTALTASLLSLAAAEIPVHTVAIGAERFPDDLELSRVEAPRTALKGSSVLVEALIRQQGGGRDSVDLVVEDGGQRLATRRLALPGDGGVASVRLPVPLETEGFHTLTVRVPARSQETVSRNNERKVLVSVVDRAEDILYYEGEPRPEFAFLRRAVRDDRQLRLVGLQRTAENKFLRLGVKDSLDLVAGFPRTREELYRYRGVVLGSVEASAFTVDQLRMLVEFVSRRGGGLLALGGRRAFAEGGYSNTPLDEVLPVRLDQPRDSGWFRELRVAVTPAGMTHPAIRLAADDAASARRWDSLPPVTSVNRVGEPRPGATVLLAGTDTAGGGTQPVLIYQRYGRGRSAALAIQDAWLWRMHADVPVEDTRHQTAMRQLLRWLTADVPERAELVTLTSQIGQGEPIGFEVEVHDAGWQPVNGASVKARVTAPSGASEEAILELAPGTDGLYRGTAPAREPGEYSIEAVAISGDDSLVVEPAFVRVGDVGREYFGAEMRPAVLRRIADETGGRSYTPATVSSLPRDVVYTERGITRTEQLDLWDMPIVFLLLLGLLSAEWGLRRRWGLA